MLAHHHFDIHTHRDSVYNVSVLENETQNSACCRTTIYLFSLQFMADQMRSLSLAHFRKRHSFLKLKWNKLRKPISLHVFPIAYYDCFMTFCGHIVAIDRSTIY